MITYNAQIGELFALCPYHVQTNSSDGKSSSGQGSGEAVEPVTDSSRYFVLRVESDDPSGQGKKRKAFIGMGFEVSGRSERVVYSLQRLIARLPLFRLLWQDRDASFDFNVALSSWAKRQRNLADVASMGGNSSGALADVDGGSEAATGPSPHLPKDGPKDLSLKQGQTFSVKLPGSGQGRKIRGVGGSSSSSGLGGMGGGGPLLPPPPSRRG